MLHNERIIYRGVNSKYIYIDNQDNAVLGNFCYSTAFGGEQGASYAAHTCIDNPMYNSPEMDSQEDNYGYTTDIWSLGVLICEMCTNEMPFSNPMYHRRGRLGEEILEKINDDVVLDIMQKCLKKTPQERISL